MTANQKLLLDVYHSSQAWAELGGETTTLPIGQAITNPSFPDHHEGNCMWDVRLGGYSTADAFRMVSEHYAERGLTCFNWTPTLGEPIGQLHHAFDREGFVPADSIAMVLQRSELVPSLPRLEMLSALDHPEQFKAVFDLPGQRFVTMNMTALHLTRAKLPQYEVFVARLNGEPVGRIGLLHIGDVGRVKSIFVGDGHRRLGVATAMISYIVELCRRKNCRCVCLDVDPNNVRAIRCYERFGFRTVGNIPTYSRRNPE